MPSVLLSELSSAILIGNSDTIRNEPVSITIICAALHDVVAGRLPVSELERWLGSDAEAYIQAQDLVGRCMDELDSLTVEDIRSVYLLAAYGDLPVTYPDTKLGLPPTVEVEVE